MSRATAPPHARDGDPLAASRGCLAGLLLSLPLWAGMVWVVVWLRG